MVERDAVHAQSVVQAEKTISDEPLPFRYTLCPQNSIELILELPSDSSRAQANSHLAV
jgi:hypothetical protein